MNDNHIILIVDDDRIQVEVVKTLLETEGYRVLTAANGRDAICHLETTAVDLILSDIAMPDMNGYQLFEQVGLNDKWFDIPFIFLTARDMDSDIRFGKSLGVDDYLLKPVSADDLLATVAGKLRRRNWREQFFTKTMPTNGTAKKVDGALEIGTLRINQRGHQIWFDGELVPVSAREFALLVTLAEREPEILTVQELVQVTHDLDTDPRDAGILIRPLIRSVRRKLGFNAGEQGCIENVRGVGYRLIPLS